MAIMLRSLKVFPEFLASISLCPWSQGFIEQALSSEDRKEGSRQVEDKN